jgi:lipid A ethanolaminephosphotransferase
MRSHVPTPPRQPVAEVGVELLILCASLYWTLAANRLFFAAALKGRSLAEPAAWGFAAAMFVLVLALHTLLLGLVANRWTVKPLLVLLTLGTALATYFMDAYGIYLDPSMLRNVLRTDPAEAGELLNAKLALHLLLYAGLPLLLLARVRVRPREPGRWLAAGGRRLLLLVLSLAALLAATLTVFQPFSSLMRNNKDLRYLITPANYLWSAAIVGIGEARGAARPRQAIGLDAAPGPSWAARRKPLVLVLVVGETARAANWGLSGYARQTTPELARLGVLNFSQVTSCGTNTEVSLPCMFAPVGRRDYDEARIRGQQSLLHVLARTGVAVHWRDNQSGCKGVCEGLPGDTVSSLQAPGLCEDGRCLDEGLVQDLDQRLTVARGTQLWVLHMLGNHGPAYHRRYPRAFARFQPDCRQDDLRQCSEAELVNAYDNALLYTDHVLASAIAQLQARAGARPAGAAGLAGLGGRAGPGALAAALLVRGDAGQRPAGAPAQAPQRQQLPLGPGRVRRPRGLCAALAARPGRWRAGSLLSLRPCGRGLRLLRPVLPVAAQPAAPGAPSAGGRAAGGGAVRPDPAGARRAFRQPCAAVRLALLGAGPGRICPCAGSGGSDGTNPGSGANLSGLCAWRMAACPLGFGNPGASPAVRDTVRATKKLRSISCPTCPLSRPRATVPGVPTCPRSTPLNRTSVIWHAGSRRCADPSAR